MRKTQLHSELITNVTVLAKRHRLAPVSRLLLHRLAVLIIQVVIVTSLIGFAFISSIHLPSGCAACNPTCWIISRRPLVTFTSVRRDIALRLCTHAVSTLVTHFSQAAHQLLRFRGSSRWSRGLSSQATLAPLPPELALGLSDVSWKSLACSAWHAIQQRVLNFPRLHRWCRLAQFLRQVRLSSPRAPLREHPLPQGRPALVQTRLRFCTRFLRVALANVFGRCTRVVDGTACPLLVSFSRIFEERDSMRCFDPIRIGERNREGRPSTPAAPELQDKTVELELDHQDVGSVLHTDGPVHQSRRTHCCATHGGQQRTAEKWRPQ